MVVALGIIVAACDTNPGEEETTTTLASTTTTAPSTTTTWPSEIRVSVDDDLAALAREAPEGTTFNLDNGLHHADVIEPKDGMTFSGSSETVLSGASPLEGFTPSGVRWELTGQPLTTDERCLPGEETCGITNDLFLDDEILTRVDTASELRSGSWWGEGDRILIADDPTGRIVELSTSSHAFAGDAADVTIRGMTVEKYAVPARDGAIQSQARNDGPLGRNWIIEDVEVRKNHAAGIRLGAGTQVRNVLAQGNGRVAVTGNSNPERLIEGVVIEGLTVANDAGGCVSIIHGADVALRDSTIGPCDGEAVYLSEVTRAEVTGNSVADTATGVLIHLSASIVVDENTFESAGRNYVQFDKVSGAGSSISGNRGESDLGASGAEDMISVFESNGTPESPIRIVGNYLRNGGPSASGSGILLGDGGGSHQLADDNRLVNTGQVGIGVASGTEITVSNNQVYSEALPWSNVGIYVWNQYPTECSSVTVAGNQVNWTSATGRENHWFNGGGCSGLDAFENEWGAEIGAGIF